MSLTLEKREKPKEQPQLFKGHKVHTDLKRVLLAYNRQ